MSIIFFNIWQIICLVFFNKKTNFCLVNVKYKLDKNWSWKKPYRSPFKWRTETYLRIEMKLKSRHLLRLEGSREDGDENRKYILCLYKPPMPFLLELTREKDYFGRLKIPTHPFFAKYSSWVKDLQAYRKVNTPRCKAKKDMLWPVLTA